MAKLALRGNLPVYWRWMTPVKVNLFSVLLLLPLDSGELLNDLLAISRLPPSVLLSLKWFVYLGGQWACFALMYPFPIVLGWAHLSLSFMICPKNKSGDFEVISRGMDPLFLENF